MLDRAVVSLTALVAAGTTYQTISMHCKPVFEHMYLGAACGPAGVQKQRHIVLLRGVHQLRGALLQLQTLCLGPDLHCSQAARQLGGPGPAAYLLPAEHSSPGGQHPKQEGWN